MSEGLAVLIVALSFVCLVALLLHEDTSRLRRCLVGVAMSEGLAVLIVALSFVCLVALLLHEDTSRLRRCLG